MSQERIVHTLDAADQSLGRLASRISSLLRGKHKPSFARNLDVGDFVTVKNVLHMRFSGKKAKQKMYYHHSGYLGGLRVKKFEQLFESRAHEVVRKAVWGMLPKNKLRAKQIQRLHFE